MLVAPCFGSGRGPSMKVWRATQTLRRSLLVGGRQEQTFATGNGAFERARARAEAFDTEHGITMKPQDVFESPLRELQQPYERSATVKLFGSHNPTHIPVPPYATSGRVMPSQSPNNISLRAKDDEPFLRKMREASRLARQVLEYVCAHAVPGRTTDQLNEAVHDAIVSSGAYPSPLNYAGFPKSVCSSVNNVICHGIPDGYVLRSGDVVSFDVSCFMGGVHGDNCATVVVADWPKDLPDSFTHVPSDFSKAFAPGHDWRGVLYKTEFSSAEEEKWHVTGRRLVQASIESLNEGILACKPGGTISDIGAAIHDVADAYGYDSVQQYRGHGIGEEFHCSPFIKHYRNNDTTEIQPGMIFTIEPMITEGSGECYEWDDQWTVVSNDGGRSSQFEHVIFVTETGIEILTQSGTAR
mmetsp:Transcript_24877/g.45049  ORF Transcript_24877/g.45049 Transcript_24877/m.45049 type:complete len:412 (-) Transcript_24877:84-1319(-)